MAQFDNSFDPDFTALDIDQTRWQGGSGTVVAEQELICVSGVLDGEISRVEDTIFPIASGLDRDLIYTLRSEGDETEAKTRLIHDVPITEYGKNSDISTWWNVRNPQGQAASGVTMFIAWFVTEPAAQNFTLKLRAKTISAGTNLSSVVETETSVNISANVDADTVQVDPITLQISPSGSFASLKLTRLGETDEFTNDLFVVANGINYLVI